MDPVLHAVSRLMQCPQADNRGLSADVTEALAGEPRLSMATRLGLVALASRIENGDPCGDSLRARTSSEHLLPQLLATLSRDDGPRAIEALVVCAPALREMAQDLARDRDPYALMPLALLELLASRLH